VAPSLKYLVQVGVLVVAAPLSCGRHGPTSAPKAPVQLPDTVTLTCRPPHVGESWTRAKSTAVEAVDRIWIDGQEVTRPRGTQGKSYLYERNAQGLSVTRADGSPVPDEEAVVKSEDYVGEPSAILVAVSGRTFRRGQAVTLNPDELRRATAGGTIQIPRIVLTYEGKVGRLARFRSQPTIGDGESGYSGVGSDTLSVDPTTCQTYELHAINTGTMLGGKLTVEVSSRRLP